MSRTHVTISDDGAVALLGLLSAKRLDAEQIILMGRHQARTHLGREFGATDAVSARGDEGITLFFAGIHTLGGPAPVCRFLPDLIQLIWNREIDPGKVFDPTLPLEQAAEGYMAMDECRATKVLLTL
ncbi:hypothetical protein NC239_34400 [Streptomyces sp. G3]|uniref:hypothetical protein n=1 Tax=Streptomyces sp. G3 TaxID=690144 RepID=UPI00202FFE1C|nr:hypothetical protein [Streptomyces sp. G3]MCM1943298.1 hypothetical protein [Streptomyces sp. G3]